MCVKVFYEACMRCLMENHQLQHQRGFGYSTTAIIKLYITTVRPDLKICWFAVTRRVYKKLAVQKIL